MKYPVKASFKVVPKKALNFASAPCGKLRAPLLAAPLELGRVVVTAGVSPSTELTAVPLVGSVGVALIATARRTLGIVLTVRGLTTMFWVLRSATPVAAWTMPLLSTLTLLVGVVRLVLAASKRSSPPELTLIDPPAPTAEATRRTPVPLTTLVPLREPAALAL